jgi:Arc/MetJ-type ribon-helix-helix transcriptional regulator
MSDTEQLTVELPADLIARLRESVRAGAFASESEAVEAVLRTWYGDGDIEQSDVETLRALIAEGLADIEAGHGEDIDVVFDELEARYKAMSAKSGQ